MNTNKILYQAWSGSEAPFIDHIQVDNMEQIVFGRYGGNSAAGACKNEDGFFIMRADDWELAMILDAHDTDESAQLLVHSLVNRRVEVNRILSQSTGEAMKSFESYLLALFSSEEYRTACKQVRGEAACLLAVRKENYVWWFSVGDCLLYIFHEEFHELGQYACNQRRFYEWIGQVNTFDREVPGYSSGIVELRPGKNQLLLLTDGVIECGERYFENPKNLYHQFQKSQTTPFHVETILQFVHGSEGRDSATVIAWEVENYSSATYPGNYFKGAKG